LVRFALMVAIFVAAFAVEHPIWQLPLAVILGGVLLSTRSMPNVYRLRLLFVPVFFMTLVVWTLFYGPDGSPPLTAVGPLVISHTAPWFALGMALKLVVFLASGVLFLSTTRVEEFSYALQRLGLPYKVGFTITMAFRLVPVFLDSAVAVVEAQRCRGLDFDAGGLWQRLRRYPPVIIPVFMGGLRRADHMAMALEARGFQSTCERTILRRPTVTAGDIVALLVIGVATLFYLTLAWQGVLRLPSPAS
jgi:energy-coupling factor transport system permease protein